MDLILMNQLWRTLNNKILIFFHSITCMLNSLGMNTDKKSPPPPRNKWNILLASEATSWCT